MPPSVRDAVDVTPAVPLAGAQVLKRRLSDYWILAKPRLSLLVLSTALVALWLGSSGEVPTGALVLFGLGMFLVIGGANAINQVIERDHDKLMARTAQRPLPSGRLEPREASVFAFAMTASGFALLAVSSSAATVALGALAVGLYVLGYTPLKRVTPWSTAVGALSGAIPPLMGWAAARSQIGPPALALFAILFVWQFPHTWAIAWLYAEDYVSAGHRVLPLVDPSGRRTQVHTVIVALGLVLASFAPYALGMVGSAYVVGVILADVLLIGLSFRFAFGRTRRAAGELLAASLAYVPLVMALLVLDRRSF